MSNGISTMSTREFFTLLSEKRLPEENVKDPNVILYVADLLERGSYGRGIKYDSPFFYSDRLTDIIKTRQKYTDPFIRMLTSRKIGDYALFMIGIFPSTKRNKDLYTAHGSDSYAGVYNYYRGLRELDLASMYDALSEYFENCVRALNKMREEDICIETDNNYDILFVPKDKGMLENLMLDAMNRWKKSKKPEDRDAFLRYAVSLGIENPEEILNQSISSSLISP